MFIQMWFSSRRLRNDEITENIATRPPFAFSYPVTSEVLMSETYWCGVRQSFQYFSTLECE